MLHKFMKMYAWVLGIVVLVCLGEFLINPSLGSLSSWVLGIAILIICGYVVFLPKK